MKTSISLALGLALVGCAAPYDWSGDWQGDIDPGHPAASPAEQTARRVTLSVKSGKDPVLTYMGFPSQGSLQTGGNHALFLGRTLMDQPLSRQNPENQKRYGQVELNASTPDTIEATIEEASGPVKVILRRKVQPTP